MTNNALERLVKNGTIESYKYITLNENGNEDNLSLFRNTERLELIFKNKEKIIIDTFCSGNKEDTEMLIK